MSPQPPRDRGAGIVVPLRSFDGKARLAAHLDADRRSSLVREMAERVVSAGAPHPVAVVSGSPEVTAWARALGADTVDDPGSLDAAADAGRRWAAGLGLSRVVVAHADLPLATSFEAVVTDGPDPVAVVVPCHRHDGTPVLSVPVDAPFRFAYGPGSFARHVVASEAAGLAVRVLEDAELGFDVDVPADLLRLDTLTGRGGAR